MLLFCWEMRRVNVTTSRKKNHLGHAKPYVRVEDGGGRRVGLQVRHDGSFCWLVGGIQKQRFNPTPESNQPVRLSSVTSELALS